MTTNNPSSLEEIWKLNLEYLVCPACSRAFLVPEGNPINTCPQCLDGQLQTFSAPLRPEASELLIPFRIQQGDLPAKFSGFCKDLWLAPTDFSAKKLSDRSIPLFFPLWLVDATCEGTWEAEAGFNYQVQSSREVYRDGVWQSQSVQETRVRWEKRLGQINRRYQNVAVRAVEDHAVWFSSLGQFDFSKSIPYDPAKISHAVLRSPDILPEKSWPDAEIHLKKLIEKDCQQASDAQQIRGFSAMVDYFDQNWTQILLPVYTSYYTADDQQKIQVLVNADTGQIYGPKIASQKKGWKTAGIIGGVGLGFIFLSILLFLITPLFPPIGVLATILMVIGIGLAVFAIVPAVYPWLWNRKQTDLRVFKSTINPSKR